MTERMKGRVVMITGASRGLGRALAYGFSREGAQLVIAARHGDLLDNIADDIRANGGAVLARRTDISNLDDVESLVDAAVQQFKRLDVLINNAAILEDQHPLMEAPPEHWLQTLTLNLTGAYYCCREVIPAMRRQSYGRLINITSEISVQPRLNYAAYGVSKAGLNALTRALALELKGAGILVNGLDPGAACADTSAAAKISLEEIFPGAFHLATLPEDGPTGKFFDRQGRDLNW